MLNHIRNINGGLLLTFGWIVLYMDTGQNVNSGIIVAGCFIASAIFTLGNNK